MLNVQIFVIPVLIGLLFELLVIVPMRVPVDESPVFLLYQDWALGLIFLKIWTRLVSFIPPFMMCCRKNCCDVVIFCICNKDAKHIGKLFSCTLLFCNEELFHQV